LPPKLLLAVAVVFALIGVAVWVTFLRPMPVRAASGRITNKTFKPAGTYWQYPAGIDRGFRMGTEIPIAEADVFELAVDGLEGPVFFSLNIVASRAFQVGHKVRIRYKERAIPFMWRRLYVIDMSPATK